MDSGETRNWQISCYRKVCIFHSGLILFSEPESQDLLRHLPVDRIFLETDGADVDIRKIYEKIASDIDISVDELKSLILKNFNDFFSLHMPV